MSEQPPFTDQFLAQVRETYQQSKPKLTSCLQEAKELGGFLSTLQFMMQIAQTPPTPGFDKAAFMQWFTRLNAYMEDSVAVMNTLSGVAASVSSVLSEHEESRYE